MVSISDNSDLKAQMDPISVTNGSIHWHLMAPMDAMTKSTISYGLFTWQILLLIFPHLGTEVACNFQKGSTLGKPKLCVTTWPGE